MLLSFHFSQNNVLLFVENTFRPSKISLVYGADDSLRASDEADPGFADHCRRNAETKQNKTKNPLASRVHRRLCSFNRTFLVHL